MLDHIGSIESGVVGFRTDFGTQARNNKGSLQGIADLIEEMMI